MANRLAAVLRFWDVLQGPRYTFWLFEQKYTLEELMEDIYRKTLEAWCPGGPASVREHMALAVERMSRATREDCLDAVLRVIPVLVQVNTDLKHPEVLSDPDFLRERLSALPPKRFEALSSAYKYSVSGQFPRVTNPGVHHASSSHSPAAPPPALPMDLPPHPVHGGVGTAPW
jgi:hypothetical protein